MAAPKGQKGLFERAFYESRLRGRPRDIYVPHSRGHRLLQLLHLLPLLLAGRAHHQDGAVAGHPGLDVEGPPSYESPRLILSIYLSSAAYDWVGVDPARGAREALSLPVAP